MHWTLPRMLTGLGFGVATIDQVLPFQCSASVWSVVLVPLPNPVAQQFELLAHVTPLRAFNVERLGFGVATVDQALPFQWAAKVFESKAPNAIVPTDQQFELVTHATEKNWLI